MNKKEKRARIAQLNRELKDAASARDALSNNGCYIGVENANNRIVKLAQERDDLKKTL